MIPMRTGKWSFAQDKLFRIGLPCVYLYLAGFLWHLLMMSSGFHIFCSGELIPSFNLSTFVFRSYYIIFDWKSLLASLSVQAL